MNKIGRRMGSKQVTPEMACFPNREKRLVENQFWRTPDPNFIIGRRKY
jgi:hypothetical protein